MTEADISVQLAEREVAIAKQRKIIADAGAVIAALEVERAELFARFRRPA